MFLRDRSDNPPVEKKVVSLRKHLRVIERTYVNNLDSDYTERIESLGKRFKYDENCQELWGEPEFSTLYGTPLFEQASPSQRLALNHLYWVGQYNHTANAEANTMLYNQVTTGVFEHIGGYETLCDELNFETSQERFHIATFQRIGYRTKLAVLGKDSLGNGSSKLRNSQKKIRKLLPKPLEKKLSTRWTSEESTSLQDGVARALTRVMYGRSPTYFSNYLSARMTQPVPTATGGLAGNTASPSVMKLITQVWGSSPFMACHYYVMRMVANMSLKAYEHQYFKRFKELERKGRDVALPTAVSHYHLLDEAFHTTMSQVIAQQVYHDMPEPTAAEKLIANLIVLQGLRGVVGGLSAWLPMTFRDDKYFMSPLYRLLQSPLFGFSQEDALYWMEKCLCQEHEGFHSNLRNHQALLATFQRFFVELDYLWPSNREVEPMTVGGSLERALHRNTQAFKDFLVSVE
ncbi:MAG: hypothetical protein F6K00_07985 [Leptolyngbya sp. SIOISBB]|nr:hypothetical protein [Leptolyngbya sp. SIOISBB]